jgi:NADP-dependent 3-hydroxy acid dehydrogenase YdfG
MAAAVQLAGRVALVTGASRGIGRRVAERLVDEGARVWCLARSEAALAELVRETGAEPLVADLTDHADTWAALDRMCDASGGPPDIVVNAAGVFGIESCATETVKRFDTHLAVNLRAPFLVIRALLPDMLERGSGLIVSIGSVAGHSTFAGNGAYSASKFGLRGLHGVLAEEVRGTGVRACLIEPAATDTELWDAVDREAHTALPTPDEMLSADDVAEAVLFVATRPGSVAVPILRVERA